MTTYISTIKGRQTYGLKNHLKPWVTRHNLYIEVAPNIGQVLKNMIVADAHIGHTTSASIQVILDLDSSPIIERTAVCVYVQ